MLVVVFCCCSSIRGVQVVLLPLLGLEMKIPLVIRKALEQGASLAVSISGGKDGQAMIKHMVDWWNKNNFKGDIFAIHSDLGRVEWKQSLPQCKKICKILGISLVVVKREKGDMIDRWQERMNVLKGTGKPFWSSSSQRYCTSDMKRAPINKYLRKYRFIISAEGIRAEESIARATKPICHIRTHITFKRLKNMTLEQALRCRKEDERLAITWNPILKYIKEEVWKTFGHTQEDLDIRRQLYVQGKTQEALRKWSFHPAYVFGNERVSCSMCVLACNSDIKNGIKHNPKTYKILRKMETDSECTFKNKKSLLEIKNS